jgi:voltage-gated potassium channel
MGNDLKRFMLAALLLLLSLCTGCIGFILIEGYSLLDSLYMTMLIISTVGFQEVEPLSDSGRLFTSIYLIFNLGILAYIVSVVTSYIFEGEFKKAYKTYLVSRVVKKMDNHIIVCGYGRNGSKVCEELIKSGKEFVLIEQDPEVVAHLPKSSAFAVITEDALTDEALLHAGVESARALITTLPRDADNVMITLTAKELNPSIFLVARAADDNAEKKLRRAGATKVVKPYSLAGIHLANMVTRPYAIEFLDLITGVEGDLKVEEFKFRQLKPEFMNKTIRELDIRNKTGGMVIGLKDPEQGFVFNPSPDTVIDEDDVLIIFGSKESIDNFHLYCNIKA